MTRATPFFLGILLSSCAVTDPPDGAGPDEPDFVHAKARSISTPVYPDEAREIGVEGTVRVGATISSRGKVLDVRIVSSEMSTRSGEYDVPYRGRRVIEEMEDAVVKAMMKWKFDPALENGNPVESSQIVPISFSMNR